MDITTSNIPWLYPRRITFTEARIWWVEMVPMYVVADTGTSAGLVAFRKVQRVERGK